MAAFKANKYHAKKITVDGMTFDSKKEYLRWQELVLLEKAEKIQNLKRQVEYLLIPAQFATMRDPKTGRMKRKCLERACFYVADFTYTEDGEFIVEDTKGFRTADYKIKRKLMLNTYGIKIRET